MRGVKASISKTQSVLCRTVVCISEMEPWHTVSPGQQVLRWLWINHYPTRIQAYLIF